MSEKKLAKHVTRSLIVESVAHLTTVDMLLRKIDSEAEQKDIDMLVGCLSAIDNKIEKLKISISNSLSELSEEEDADGQEFVLEETDEGFEIT